MYNVRKTASLLQGTGSSRSRRSGLRLVVPLALLITNCLYLSAVAGQPQWQKISEDDLYIVYLDKNNTLKEDRVIHAWLKYHKKDFRIPDEFYRHAFRCDKRQIIPEEHIVAPDVRRGVDQPFSPLPGSLDGKILDAICSSGGPIPNNQAAPGAAPAERVAELNERIAQLDEQIRLIRIHCDISPYLRECSGQLSDKIEELNRLKRELAEISN